MHAYSTACHVLILLTMVQIKALLALPDSSPTMLQASNMVCCALNTSGFSEAGSLHTRYDGADTCLNNFWQATVCRPEE
jgi:hypothetical protein